MLRTPSSLMLFVSVFLWMGVATVIVDGVKHSFEGHSL